jgi:hypothetical protein
MHFHLKRKELQWNAKETIVRNRNAAGKSRSVSNRSVSGNTEKISRSARARMSVSGKARTSGTLSAASAAEAVRDEAPELSPARGFL